MTFTSSTRNLYNILSFGELTDEEEGKEEEEEEDDEQKNG